MDQHKMCFSCWSYVYTLLHSRVLHSRVLHSRVLPNICVVLFNSSFLFMFIRFNKLFAPITSVHQMALICYTD